MNNADQKRHKCHKCSAVRYEYLMRKLSHQESTASFHFGNDSKCWVCIGECWNKPKV